MGGGEPQAEQQAEQQQHVEDNSTAQLPPMVFPKGPSLDVLARSYPNTPGLIPGKQIHERHNFPRPRTLNATGAENATSTLRSLPSSTMPSSRGDKKSSDAPTYTPAHIISSPSLSPTPSPSPGPERRPFIEPTKSAAILICVFMSIALFGYIALLLWRRVLE